MLVDLTVKKLQDLLTPSRILEGSSKNRLGFLTKCGKRAWLSWNALAAKFRDARR
jgi:hypothetical protein